MRIFIFAMYGIQGFLVYWGVIYLTGGMHLEECSAGVYWLVAFICSFVAGFIAAWRLER